MHLKWRRWRSGKRPPDKIDGEAAGQETDGDDVVDDQLPEVGPSHVKERGQQQRVVERRLYHVVPPESL